MLYEVITICMKVFYYDIENKLSLGNAIQVPTLDELLAISDVVSLHVPETPSVITSYSIHYTKLYDSCLSIIAPCRQTRLPPLACRCHTAEGVPMFDGWRKHGTLPDPCSLLGTVGTPPRRNYPNAHARGGNFSPIHYRESPNWDHPLILLVA